MKKTFCAVLAAAILFLSSTSCSGIQAEYIGDYTATLYVDENPIPCIVYIDESISSNKSEIYTLYLPYDTEYRRLCVPFDPEAEFIPLDLGSYWALECRLEIGELAPQDISDWLPYIFLVPYGDFCGDRVTRESHFTDCPNVANISRSQLVFFRSDNEAEVLQFEFCPDCRERF